MANPPALVLNKDQKSGLVEYARRTQELLNSQVSLRASMEETDRVYMREKNYTREQWEARLSNYYGDASKIQDVTIPIVMPQVESALTYMTNVFVTGYPTFGVIADPNNIDEARAMEAIIAENSRTAGWSKELIMFLRDGLKYNLHAIECSWEQQVVYRVDNNITRPNGAQTKNTIWNGNVLRRMDLYNTIYDPRVPVTRMHLDGEFAGYINLMGRVALKKFISEMLVAPRDEDVREAFNSPGIAASVGGYNSPYGYYKPLINPFPVTSRSNNLMMDWMAWAQNTMPGQGDEVKSPYMYEVLKLYCRIIPEDFKLNVPDSKLPQVWKLYIINRSVLLYAERQSNAHNMIPIFFGQPLEDGLEMQTKSFAQNVSDLQAVGSALANGYIATMRRNVSDRGIYNPMYISHKDMKSVDPAAKIPLKPAGYGQKPSDVYFPIPFHPENSETMLSGVAVAAQWADKVNGQNPAQQGQFVKGNKTQSEYDDVMGHGNGRNQMMAIMTEAQVFTPMKEVIKLNILQYQQNGPIYSNSLKQQVQVDVTSLRETAVEFLVSDGVLPTDKLMSSDDWTVALQTLATSPGIGGGYNLAPLFTYLMKTKNVDLSPFEKSQLQMQYEQQMGAWQQVAEAAIKAGQTVPPQPQPSQQLQKEMQQKQQNGGITPTSNDGVNQALQSTQGGTGAQQ